MSTGCNNSPASPFSKSAEMALSTFTVPEGFKIELIASEPLITDPVDMMIDENGHMYVVVMPGYPLDVKGSGKIMLLTDTNGDGKMDSSTVFAEGLILPNGIMRWKKGILVTDSPNILYLEDTDGDNRADIKDTVITGFALTNPQHNLNNPEYALDNWIYVAHEGTVKTRNYAEEFGDQGTEIYFPKQPNGVRLPKNANGRSIRFNPDHNQLEMTSSQCQFGHTFDEWGHWFGCNNSNQGYEEVIPNRYFERNPYLLISDAVQSMSDHLNAPEVFPTTTNPDRQLLTNVGVMTSGGGLTAYLGNAFPAPFNGRVMFITECVSNLVHADVLKDSGTSFVASRIFPNKEFLTSTDAWSRPVNMYVGPDGALYVLDYYRRVIESPEWMSEQAIAEGGLYDGLDKGRIYRITPSNAASAEWTKGLTLGKAGVEELAEQLANPNIWWRINAQRLLVDRMDKAAIPHLNKMAENAGSPMGRLHALWTLEGMGALNPELIERALKDSVAGIRENAVRLAEFHLSATPGLAKALLAMQDDPDTKVRLQLLLTLGFIHTPESVQARNRLLFRDINDKWVQIAALSAPPAQAASLLNVVLEKFQADHRGYASLVERLTAMIGAGADAKNIQHLIQQAVAHQPEKHSWQAPVLEGLAQGIKNSKSAVAVAESDQKMLIKAFFESASEALRRAALSLLKTTGISNGSLKADAIRKAVAMVSDTSLPDKQRADAINFIALGDPAPYIDRLKKLLVPQEKLMVQVAALQTLSLVPSNGVCEYLVQQWPALTNDVREEAVGVFLTNPERMKLLIDALEAGKIPGSSVSFTRSVRLMQVNDDSLRKRARTFFTKNQQQAKEINKAYQVSLEMKGDPEKGKQVYLQNCVICHQVRGKFGVSTFGPDLGTIHNWKKEDIMANVIDPGLSISAGYELWEAELNNGEFVQGIIASETPTAITLKNNGKPDITINRQEIKSLKSLNISAMPSGLEQNIDKQAMTDLLAFLRQN
ncbi:MAG: c-type cytochrome [Chitinophagaceae bacterium]|nr:c-type cytochrome [Chitinophagaceae bacterium]